MQATGKATFEKSTFRRETSVTINIQAPPEKVWGLMTDIAAIPNWNSTIISLGGTITQGSKIELKSTLAPDRTFNLTVSEMTAPTKMVWQDGFAPMFQGVRTYLFEKQSDDSTNFSMTEVNSGLMLPLIGGSLPDFQSNFEQFATDLKTAAESS